MSKIKKSILLKSHTTFQIGGLAKYFVEVTTKQEILDVDIFAKNNKLRIVVLGGGSNVLINDKGVDGIVVSLLNDDVSIKQNKHHVVVTVGAGKNWDELVGEMVKKGYQGIECLSGIPGKMGAAPIQNIGAYGQEIKDTFFSLLAFDTVKGRFVRFDKKACKFGYRDSVFKQGKNKGRYIIYEVKLRLKNDNTPKVNYQSLANYLIDKKITKPTIVQLRKAVLQIRDEKLENPKIHANSGSFFKNPIVRKTTLSKLLSKYPDMPYFPYEKNTYKLYAGWLIDNTGWRGKKYKNVAVSSKHALVLINPENKGTAKEIKELAKKITDDIYKKFGVKLEPEVQFL